MYNQPILLIVVSGFISSQSQSPVIHEGENPMQNVLKNTMIDCSHDYPMTAMMMELVQAGNLPDVEVVKCFFACVYRKTGALDEQGKLSLDKVYELTMKSFADDPVRRSKAMQLAEACEYVNQIPVKDGTRGCDRAAMIYKCTVENAAQYGLNPNN